MPSHATEGGALGIPEAIHAPRHGLLGSQERTSDLTTDSTSRLTGPGRSQREPDPPNSSPEGKDKTWSMPPGAWLAIATSRAATGW